MHIAKLNSMQKFLQVQHTIVMTRVHSNIIFMDLGLAPLFSKYLIMIYSVLLKNVISLIMPMTIHFQKFQVQLML